VSPTARGVVTPVVVILGASLAQDTDTAAAAHLPGPTSRPVITAPSPPAATAVTVPLSTVPERTRAPNDDAVAAPATLSGEHLGTPSLQQTGSDEPPNQTIDAPTEEPSAVPPTTSTPATPLEPSPTPAAPTERISVNPPAPKPEPPRPTSASVRAAMDPANDASQGIAAKSKNPAKQKAVPSRPIVAPPAAGTPRRVSSAGSLYEMRKDRAKRLADLDVRETKARTSVPLTRGGSRHDSNSRSSWNVGNKPTEVEILVPPHHGDASPAATTPEPVDEAPRPLRRCLSASGRARRSGPKRSISWSSSLHEVQFTHAPSDYDRTSIAEQWEEEEPKRVPIWQRSTRQSKSVDTSESEESTDEDSY
jgi:hypothetical protein